MDDSQPSARPIAPLWHTGLMLVLLLGIAMTEALTHHLTGARTSTANSRHAGRLLGYFVTMVWEWILFAFAWWGVHLRGVQLRRVLSFRRGAVEFWMDIAIGLGFWFGSMLALSVAASLLRLARMHPENIRDVVARLAPTSTAELLTWIALSVSAGICEEFIFRGYLQQQFSALTRRTWLGIAIAAIIFGSAHVYEGSSGMLLITVYGALFGVLAHFRRSLRPGMFAHAWHDSLSGLVLYFGSHFLSRLPH